MPLSYNRRQFIQGLTLGAIAASTGLSAHPIQRNSPFARSRQQPLIGHSLDLVVGRTPINITGKPRHAITINGTMPAPTLYLKQGQQLTVRVHNTLDEDTSIHWHGLLLPYQMDGVPHLSFAGIKPKQTFTYQFPLIQNGTYWYHSHSGWQEQLGMLGAMIIQPEGIDPIQADREHVVVLSDWTDDNPHSLLRRLKTHSDFDNYHLPSLHKLITDLRQHGSKAALAQRQMWNQMRMMPTDFTDLSGVTTFTYLINGVPPTGNWTGLFNHGETIRLRLINASAQSIFDFRIPELAMTVVGTDGGLVEPVTVDEIRIGVAETYDVLIRPQADAYTLFAQDIGRSGYLRGTLAIQEGLSAPVPQIDPIEWLSMTDMMGDPQSGATAHHAHTEYGWSTDMRVDTPRTNLDDAGVNLRNNGRRVLTYADLHSIGEAIHEQRPPTRDIEMHLTGNMERYVWGFDGVPYADARPVHIGINERVRIHLVNDTMMTHPMHLHGMWSDLRNPQGDFQVRKHTLLVHPAQKVAFDVTGEQGRWAWHCHLMYHMEAGMFREVVVD
ncbi:MAG: copper resistance system multicopper oxidase [Pseudomonadota bacterium]|nr:copper resistance system multicopper oxidase [Pseudomonadota bacterium]